MRLWHGETSVSCLSIHNSQGSLLMSRLLGEGVWTQMQTTDNRDGVMVVQFTLDYILISIHHY